MSEKRPVKDLIMWVGARSYPTWESFAVEAERMGVCKRIRAPPLDVTPGYSRVFLVHGERRERVEEVTDPLKIGLTKRVKRHDKPQAFIYGYFVLGGWMIASVEQVTGTEPRGCGLLEAEALYLLSDPEQVSLVQVSLLVNDRVILRGPIAQFKTPIPYVGRTFPGYRYFEASTIGVPPITAPVTVERAVSVQGPLEEAPA